MTVSPSTALDLVWPDEPRARALAIELYDTVADLPMISMHNGLPARYLADDLPITDPISLLVSHDQAVQALLRTHGWRSSLGLSDARQTERASRQAFVLLWRHMVDVLSKPWIGADEYSPGAGLTPFRADQDPEKLYDELAGQLAADPKYPRRTLEATRIALLATSDDPADDLESHQILAEDSTWAGRVIPTFSADRYLEPFQRTWRTDAELLAEITGIGTEELSGFIEALQQRRLYFIERGAVAAELHASDIEAARLADPEATELFRLARSGDALPDEAAALQRHLLWEMGRMSAEDGLVMALYPPAGFRSAAQTTPDDAQLAERIRPLLHDFGAKPGFHLQISTVDARAYTEDLVPLATTYRALTLVPPTRFVDHPASLRALRTTAVEAIGTRRTLGVVDDMNGHFAMAARHRLGRRVDAGALAELVVAGHLSADTAQAELTSVVSR